MSAGTPVASSTKWPDEHLTAMRMQGDPPADAAIARLFQSGQVGRVHELLTALIRHEGIPPEGLDPDIAEYLRATARIPEMDRELVREAQLLFRQHGNLALFVLLCSSLPECYTMKKGAQVLWLTQRLQEHVLRRLLETAQMVLRVMTPGGLEPGGAGLEAAVKVRLMHAAIRHLILHPTPPDNGGGSGGFAQVLLKVTWDTENLGYPINQTDLAFTLLTFSYVIPRGLETLGVKVTQEQKEAFIHTWNVIGRAMGIDESLLVPSYQEAASLFALIKRLDGGESKAGREMTAAIIKVLKEAIPGHLVDFLPQLLMRELLDAETISMLGVPRPSRVSVVAQKLLAAQLRGVAFVKRASGNHLVLTPRIWEWLAGHIVTYLSNYRQPRGWKRELFKIPDDLAAHWSVPKFD